MTYGQNELQKAVYDVLAADAELSALVSAIYDHIPPNAQYPFIAFGSIDTRDWSGLTMRGIQTRLSLHVFSRGGGRREALAIQDSIHAALDRAELVLPSHELVAMRFELGNVTLERDGRTYHGMMRFIAYTEQLEAA